jgi:hypothetical protein
VSDAWNMHGQNEQFLETSCKNFDLKDPVVKGNG